MESRNSLQREYVVASDAERKLWAKVKGMHPGQPGHDAEQWRLWLKAADQVQTLARALRAGGDHSPPHVPG